MNDNNAQSDSRALAAWKHATVDIPQGGLTRHRKASQEERSAIAAALGLKSLDGLEADYRIASVSGGGWHLKGEFKADVVQACVVTLEPVPATINETFDVEFWSDLDEPEGGEDKSVLAGPDIERLTGEDIPVGRIVFEALSAGLEPYPRKEGAAFDWQDPKAQGGAANSPFSVLSRLKDKD